MPVLIDCNFIVDSSNVDGISDLKGPYVEEVLMNSSDGTPSSNIAAGYILVRLEDNFNKMLSGVKAMVQINNSGSDVKIDNSAMTAGVAYTITTLGNASAAKWRAIGVPSGVTAAVGVSFIAATNGGSGNTLTSRVQAVDSTSSIASVEIVGDPNKSVAPAPSANQGFGAQIILVCRDFAGAIAAPDDDCKISLQFLMSNSSISAGE